MRQAVPPRCQSVRFIQRQWCGTRAKYHVTRPHACGEVQNHSTSASRMRLSHFAVELRIRVEGAPVSGSRTWQCTIAAPALARDGRLAIWFRAAWNMGRAILLLPDPRHAQVIKNITGHVQGHLNFPLRFFRN